MVVIKRTGVWLGTVVQTCNPSTWEAEAGDQEFEDSLGYGARPVHLQIPIAIDFYV
jgi:hypothetical protein